MTAARARAWSLLLIGLALFSPAASFAAKGPCQCKDLPAMEQELFEQEWLQREFYEYLIGNKPPPTAGPNQTSAGALSNQVTQSFNQWRRSAAGGGGQGSGGAALGMSWAKCSLVSYNGKKEVPFDEPRLRAQNCQEVADFLIAHEQKHVDQCKALSIRQNPSSWMDYAAFDVEAYGAGIKALRKSIAELAKKCGWAGSTNETKKNAIDGQEVDVVPTMQEAKELAKALKGGSKP